MSTKDELGSVDNEVDEATTFLLLATELHDAGPEATGLMFQIMAHQTRDAHWIREQLYEADQRRIKDLEAENLALRTELAKVRGNILALVYPFNDGSEWR